jgi:hypothetical protein
MRATIKAVLTFFSIRSGFECHPGERSTRVWRDPVIKRIVTTLVILLSAVSPLLGQANWSHEHGIA